MNGRGIQLGSILGIPVDLDRSWFIVFFLLTWLLAADFYPAAFPGWPAWLYWGMGAVAAVGLFASVLLHELGHSAVALHYKVPVSGITLFLFGGVSRLDGEPPGPRAEFLIAIAGPLVSLALGAAFFLVQPLTRFSEPLYGLAVYLGTINIVLFLFNLIPGYPLDGGRVFRSVAWVFTKDLRRATVIAAHVGRVFGVLFVAWGAWRMVSVNVTAGIWLMLIGWFLYAIATSAVAANQPPKA